MNLKMLAYKVELNEKHELAFELGLYVRKYKSLILGASSLYLHAVIRELLD